MRKRLVDDRFEHALDDIKPGYVFNSITILDRGPNSGSGGKRWLCRCQCGNEWLVATSFIRKGKPQSCGCVKANDASERMTKHGQCSHPLYRVWTTMKFRCYNDTSSRYDRYGGRGIDVCDRWRESFANFIEDMGERPSPRHQIDRIDNDKGYSPENCRWATRSENQRNTRRNVILTVDGTSKCLTEWAEQFGINPFTLKGRLNRGWDAKTALTTPLLQESWRKAKGE